VEDYIGLVVLVVGLAVAGYFFKDKIVDFIDDKRGR